MPPSLTRIKSAYNAIMNLADSYTDTPADNRAYGQELTDLAITIEIELIAAGLRNSTWSNRGDFQQSTSVAHLAILPSRIGPIDAVIVGGKLASPAPLDQIENEIILRALGVTEFDPHYNADGMFLGHNGASAATVKSCTITRTNSLQGPEYLEGAIIRGLLSLAASPEGESPDMLAAYRQQYLDDLRMTEAGQVPPPFQMPPTPQG